MSIPQTISGTDTQIQVALAASFREWLPYKPDPDFVQRRWVFLTEEAYGQCHPSCSSTDPLLRGRPHQNLRIQLLGFVGGDEVNEGKEMTWLQPHTRNLWELRAWQDPAARLFGWFAAYDVFVGTHVVLRSALGRGGATAWNSALEKCERKCVTLGSPVFAAPTFDAHMSNGARNP